MKGIKYALKVKGKDLYWTNSKNIPHRLGDLSNADLYPKERGAKQAFITLKEDYYRYRGSEYFNWTNEINNPIEDIEIVKVKVKLL